MSPWCTSQELLQGIPSSGIFQTSFLTRTLAYVAISDMSCGQILQTNPPSQWVSFQGYLNSSHESFCGEVGGVVWASVWRSEGNLGLCWGMGIFGGGGQRAT